MRSIVIIVGLLCCGALGNAHQARSETAKATTRAIGELAGKFKWGMSPDDVTAVIARGIHERYVALLKKEQDIYRQDQLRKEEADEIEKVKASLVNFDGQKSGWDVSIIDKEFVHRNHESMMTMWEKDQRRFLFFWNNRLYKQFIAFNAEHPIFKGKSFDDFAQLIQSRYGQAETKFAPMRTKDEVQVDHLEWPPAGDFILWAMDQSGFYGNFCLSVTQASVAPRLEKARQAHLTRRPNGNALIDAVTAPAEKGDDPNADVVDQILKSQNEGANRTKKK